MSSLTAALIHFLWQGFLLAVLAAMLLCFTRKRSPQIRYLIACAALAAMASAPVLTVVYLNWNGNVPPTTQPSGIAAKTIELNAWTTSNSSPWLVFLWMIGVALLALRQAGSFALVSSRMRNGRIPAPSNLKPAIARLSERLGLNFDIPIYLSSAVSTPSVYGILRPFILLPMSCLAQLPPEQIESILAHELAHIARRDFLVNCLQVAVECLLFYHPAVWWISARIRFERELCCDDIAVTLSGNRTNYARALLALEELRAEHLLIPAATGSNLPLRIQRLLRPAESRSDLGISRLAVLLPLMTIVISAGLWIANAQQTPAQPAQVSPAEKVRLLRLKLEMAKMNSRTQGPDPTVEFLKKQLATAEADLSRTQSDAAREEHRRRVQYARDHFSGEDTPRGQIYVSNGPPPEIESHPQQQKEVWRYTKSNTEFEFTGANYDLTSIRVNGAEFKRAK